MKTRFIRFIATSICAWILIFLFLPVSQASARSYHFANVSIAARVTPEGDMWVNEERTAVFNGSYKGMYMWILTPSPTSVTNVTVSENGTPYTYNTTGNIGPAGTYFTRQEQSRIYIDWSFEAADEQRTFTITYQIRQAVKAHEDVAELYYQFVGSQWETRTDSVSVTLVLPDGAKKEDIRAWGHGPLHGVVTIPEGNLVTWSIAKLPAKTFLEGRVTFPLSLVPYAANRTGQTALPGILDTEERLAGDANRIRSRDRLSTFLAALIIFGSLGVAFYAWLHYGKEFTPTFDADYYRDLPAAYTPAELGVLWRFGKPGPEDLTATLIDLARKGFLRIEEVTIEKRGFLGREKQDYKVFRVEKNAPLSSHEAKLLDLLFKRVSTTGSFTFDELESYAKKKPAAFRTFWQDWQATVLARGSALDFFDTTIQTPKALLIGLGVIMIPLGVFLGSVLTPALIAGGLIITITSILLRRRSHRGVEDFARWRAFRRFLLDFSNMQEHELPTLTIWEHYMVYAITLGVAKEVIRQLQIVYPQLESGGHRFGSGWYLYGMNSNSFGSMTRSFDQIQSQISQTIRNAVSQQSSGAGRGGGFSGGGGRGGGGGGGGAR